MINNNEFIYQIGKKELPEGIKLTLFSTDSKNNTKTKHVVVPYVIFVKEKDFEILNIKSDKILLAEQDLKNKNDEKVLKLEINNKELYDFLLSKLKEEKFNIYEGDLPVEHRYLIDNNLSLINFEKSDKNKPYIPLKYLSIDIESIGKDITNQEIIMISSYSPNKFAKVYVNEEKISKKQLEKAKKTNFKGFEVVFTENEKELLLKFKEETINFSPQTILGWNVIDFDFKVIRKRMKLYDIEFKFSKFEGECKLNLRTDFFKESTVNCFGLLVFDVIHLLKTNYLSFEDYKLNTVAKEVLGDKKINLSEDETEEFKDKIAIIENLYKNDPVKLINYNFKDSLLVSEIVEKLKLLELMCKRSIITNTPLVKVKSPIATLDIMYLRKLHKRGYVALSNFNYDQTTPIEGAYVITPKKGFYENIFVFDFKSLYPSIIMTFNIDPFTFQENGQIKAPNGAKFNEKPGILPEIINMLYKERDIAKKENDKIKSHALKITMNSFYGAMASSKSRFHNRDVGGAITAFGREIIQKSKNFIEKKGHKVIYGDTDSIFIKFNKKFNTFEEKKEFGLKIEKEMNKFFDEWVEKEFGQKSFLSIELEKIFSKFFIASKKRYVGFDEFIHKITFTGMEAIRGDWTELAQNFQVSLVKQIFAGGQKKDIEKFILNYVDRLKNHEFDNILIYKKKITKPLTMYIKTTPPHVKAAREVKNFSGRIVKYVLTDKGPRHISFVDKNTVYDYEHYIDKQLKGVSDDLLETIGVDFDGVLQAEKQKSLSQFW